MEKITNLSFSIWIFHVHRVVSLMLLAHRVQDQETLSKALLAWAFKWKNYIDSFPDREGKKFWDCQLMLNDINKRRNIVDFTSFEELQGWAHDFYLLNSSSY